MKLSRDAYYLAVIALLVALLGQIYYSFEYKPAQERKITVYYNKDIEANRKIIKEIQSADQFVYFAIYTFTRTDIKDALLAAKKRGVKIKGVTDKTQLERIDLQKDIINELQKAEIPIFTQNHLGIMHLKTLVTEKAYVSGSYNWTSAATNLNDEILEIGYDENIRSAHQSVLEKLMSQYGK